MKIIFAGTPEFASQALQAIIDHKLDIVAVYTQPDRPAGRGMKLQASAVKKVALAHELPVFQPNSLKSEEEQQHLRQFNADVMVVAAYGLLLPEAVLHIPKFGCINIHASLLPRWRGAAPINRAIEAGDAETGVTIMQMDKGLDTGDMLLKKSCPILEEDTAKTLHDRLAKLGAEAIVEYLIYLEQHGPQHGQQQDNDQANYASKLNKQEALIDWSQPAQQLVNKVRALSPWPVAFGYLEGKALKIWMAQKVDLDTTQTPGSICAVNKDSFDVATGEGLLRITQVQKAGSKAVSVRDFLNGNPLKVGQQFHSTES